MSMEQKKAAQLEAEKAELTIALKSVAIKLRKLAARNDRFAESEGVIAGLRECSRLDAIAQRNTAIRIDRTIESMN